MATKLEFETDISRALTITGYMSDAELRWLAERACEHELIVEIGSFYGRSTRALAEHTLGRVWAIDRWRKMSYMDLSPTEESALFETFLINTRDLINTGKLAIVRAEHDNVDAFPVEWLRSADPAQHPDMVFIDGGHEYSEVKRDILIWKERIRPGGLLCGHDKNNGWPGVDEAVAELLPEAKTVEGTALWFWWA